MKKRFLLSLVLMSALLTGGPTAAWAEMMHQKESQVMLNVPDGWKMSTDNEITTLATTDDLMMVMFWSVEEEELEEALTAWYTEMHKMMTDIKENQEEPEETKVGGFEAVKMDGTGLIDGLETKWDTTVILAAKPLIMVTVSFKDGQQRYGSALKQMLASIKPHK